tara:strand:+ start:1112 stop:1315 length:204 start_codon:yes stop_codon:yes gene_type:complete
MNKYIMIIALVLFSTNVMANEKVTTWLQNEKTKTVEYQKKSWADGKKQLASTWLKIKSLVNKNDTQD